MYQFHHWITIETKDLTDDPALYYTNAMKAAARAGNRQR